MKIFEIICGGEEYTWFQEGWRLVIIDSSQVSLGLGESPSSNNKGR